MKEIFTGIAALICVALLVAFLHWFINKAPLWFQILFISIFLLFVAYGLGDAILNS